MKKLSKADSKARKTRCGRILASPLAATLMVGSLLLAISFTLQVARAGKPQPPPPVPPVYYNIVQLGPGAAFDMNDDGILVGNLDVDGVRRAFQFDVLNGATDLNEIPGATLVDLDGPIGSPVFLSETDWIAARALGINNWGEIVGKAQNSIGDVRVFHLSGNVFQLLPGLVAGITEGGRVDINDLGTICIADLNNSVDVYIPNEFGIYDAAPYKIDLPISASIARINNFGVIVATNNLFQDEATSIMIEPGPGETGYIDVSTTTFQSCALRHISDYWMCGVRAKVGKINGGPIRVSIATSSVEALTKTNYPWSAGASDVNNDGDVVSSAMQTLYKDGISYSLDDLIAPEDRDIWNGYDYGPTPQGISERLDLDTPFPLIHVSANGVSGVYPELLLLVPRTP